MSQRGVSLDTHTFWLSLILFRRTLICKNRGENSKAGAQVAQIPCGPWRVGGEGGPVRNGGGGTIL